MSNLFSASRQKFTGSDEPEFFGAGSASRSLPPGVALAFYGGKGASSSQTVSIPPEIMARYNAVNARAENVAATPFTPYSSSPEAFVAGLTPSQEAGIANINAAQGMATPDVKEGQGYQRQGIDTARLGQSQANAIDQAALQGISQAQQQGTAYNQAAGQNIFNAMGSAAPYMNQMGQLTQAGLGQGQQYLGGATDLTRQAIATGQQYANQAQPYYTGAVQAAQPFNYAAQNYLAAGAQNIGPGGLDYAQYMNPYMSNVVQAQQALQAQENARQRSAMQGQAIQAGAFGGDRAGIEQANLARQQSLANQATLANLLQSGYGQAQAMAQQQQGVGLAAAQANRAAQQQAAQQAAALGQQQYGQQLGLGQALAALGQQQYGQALGTGSQLGTLGQQGFGQNLQAGAQLGQLGQNLYGQNIGQGQAIQGLGNQQFMQGLQGSQAAAGIGQNIFGNAAQTAGITQAGGMNIGNLGLQNQAAQIAAAQAQMAAGQQQQQTEQAGKTALYNQYLQQQGYPFQTAQFLANIAEGTGALSGSTTTAQRTGQRGGRMGDGYASGGLVPNSQGGVVYEPGLYGRGGFDDGGVAADAQSQAAIDRNAAALTGAADATKTSAMTEAQKAMPFNADATALAGLDPKIADLYQKELGRTPDAAGARYWQDMLNAGMSIDQIKYNMEQSPEYLRKTGDVNTLKGAPLTYDPSKFAKPAGLTMNQYGSYSAAPPMATGKGPQAPMGYGNMGGGYGGYGGFGGYGGGYGGLGGYQQPMNYSAMGGYGGYGGGYGMPNFGSSPMYGGAPDYAGAMQYATNMYQPQSYYGGYGMPPQMGGYGMPPQMGGYGMPPQNYGMQQQYQMQQAPQATGKGIGAPQQPSPPPSTGKGPSTGMKAGGRTAFADGGRAGYLGGGPVPGDPYGLTQNAAAMYSGIPYLQAAGGQGGLNIPMGGAGQRQLMQPQRSILPTQENAIEKAAKTGTSIASLADAGGKFYDKLTAKPKTGETASTLKEGFGNAVDKTKNFFGFGDKTASMDMPNTDKIASMDMPNFDTAGMPDAAGKGISAMAANGGRIGHNSGGRAGYYGGGIPGLADLRKGQADIPGGEGSETPLSDVVKQGTQTPSELKAEMDKMGGGGGGLGGGGGGSGVAGAIGTAASIMSLGNAAMSAGSWIGSNVLPFLAALLATGGRVDKAGGGGVTTKLVNTRDPRYRQMEVAFDNLLKRYDNNPLLAAAAMDAGVKVVDAAIRKAGQTGKDISDFLPRRTQEYMYALSQAAIGAHKSMTQKQAPVPGLMPRAAGGRTGYALPGFVDEENNVKISPDAPFEGSLVDNAEPTGVVPKGDNVQVAELAPRSVRNNNPGNIEAGEFAKSQPGYKGSDGRFAIFETPEHGASAMDALLVSYGKRGFTTPESIIGRWAPASDNNDVSSYANTVAKALGVKPTDKIDMSDPDVRQKLAQSMAGVEAGGSAPTGGKPEKPVQVAAATGVAGAPKMFSEASSPWQKTAGKILPDVVPTDSTFWVPLIAGLGSMLASNQYRFSQRLGEGLIGGAAAYTKMSALEAENEAKRATAEETRAKTLSTYANIPQSAIFTRDGRQYVILETGAPMLVGDYLSLPEDKRPRIIGEKQAGAYGQPPAPAPAPKPAAATPAAGAPAATTPAPAAGTPSTVTPPTVTPPPPAPAAQKEAAASPFVPTPEEAKEAFDTTKNWGTYGHNTKEPDFYTDQSLLASGAQKQKQILLPLASDMASLPRTGAASSGPAQAYLNPIAAYLNNLANIAGSPGLIVDPSVLANQEGVKKLVTQLQTTATTTAGQHAYQAFKSMADGIPSLINSPEGQAKLIAQMMTNTQREIDKDNYFSEYRKAAQGDQNWLADTASQTSRIANRNFDNRVGNKFYAEERDNLEKMFKTMVVPKNPDGSKGEPISVLALLTSGKPVSDDFKKQISEKYGQHIFRYFGM